MHRPVDAAAPRRNCGADGGTPRASRLVHPGRARSVSALPTGCRDRHGRRRGAAVLPLRLHSLAGRRDVGQAATAPRRRIGDLRPGLAALSPERAGSGRGTGHSRSRATCEHGYQVATVGPLPPDPYTQGSVLVSRSRGKDGRFGPCELPIKSDSSDATRNGRSQPRLGWTRWRALSPST
jgi:hypothetical protein